MSRWPYNSMYTGAPSLSNPQKPPGRYFCNTCAKTYMWVCKKVMWIFFLSKQDDFVFRAGKEIDLEAFCLTGHHHQRSDSKLLLFVRLFLVKIYSGWLFSNEHAKGLHMDFKRDRSALLWNVVGGFACLRRHQHPVILQRASLWTTCTAVSRTFCACRMQGPWKEVYTDLNREHSSKASLRKTAWEGWKNFGVTDPVPWVVFRLHKPERTAFRCE